MNGPISGCSCVEGQKSKIQKGFPMYKILLAAGAASLAFAAPALADPGKSKGNHAKHGQTISKVHGKQAKHARKIYQGHAAANYWGNGNCPPGLDKKNN